MNEKNIAPCGLLCDLCLGAQREKNRCSGCRYSGERGSLCTRCGIRNCKEKNGDIDLLCNICEKYPCRRLKNLEKRYSTKYGESLMENFRIIENRGIEEFLKEAEKKWRCTSCGELLCVHRKMCFHCGEKNFHFPNK